MEQDQLKKAKGYALRLFKLRPRSSKELADKLKGKGYSSDVIAQVMGDMASYGYLDDRTFAKVWVNGRIKRYGHQRISRELKLKGVAQEIIDQELAQAREEYDETNIARGLAERRFKNMKGIDHFKQRRRISDHLLRRGFSSQVVMGVIRELF